MHCLEINFRSYKILIISPTSWLPSYRMDGDGDRVGFGLSVVDDCYQWRILMGLRVHAP